MVPSAEIIFDKPTSHYQSGSMSDSAIFRNYRFTHLVRTPPYRDSPGFALHFHTMA